MIKAEHATRTLLFVPSASDRFHCQATNEIKVLAALAFVYPNPCEPWYISEGSYLFLNYYTLPFEHFDVSQRCEFVAVGCIHR